MKTNSLLQRVESPKQRRILYELKDRLEKRETRQGVVPQDKKK